MAVPQNLKYYGPKFDGQGEGGHLKPRNFFQKVNNQHATTRIKKNEHKKSLKDLKWGNMHKNS